jgi:hypothetical protein
MWIWNTIVWNRQNAKIDIIKMGNLHICQNI